MSATMTPPTPVRTRPDTVARRPRPVAAPAQIRTEPHARPSRLTHLSASTERFRHGLFITMWAPALAVASVLGAAVLAVAQPIVLAREMYGERRYR
jgi:hypothetical protein